jgi:glycosyltransferase involved in cell wall biosynthesis
MKNGKVHVWLPTIRAGSGTDVFTIRLAQALESRGLSTQIDWFSPRFEFAPFLLRKVPVPTGTDIVFANSWNGFAFKRKDIPLVITAHHPEFTSADPQFGILRLLYHRILIRHYQEASFRAANAITAVSAFTARSLENTPHAGKLKVIYNWVDLEKFHPGAHPQEPRKSFQLLFVGNLSYRKGADLLPVIMRELGGEFQLDVIAGPKAGEEANFPPNMTLLGRVSDAELVAAYQHCDALLFPSRWEGFGYTALEAMACGKPVISTNASAIPEIVLDGETGILCESGNVSEFVTACRRLRATPALPYSMAIAGRQRAVDVFSESQLIGKYLDLIHQLLDTVAS